MVQIREFFNSVVVIPATLKYMQNRFKIPLEWALNVFLAVICKSKKNSPLIVKLEPT